MVKAHITLSTAPKEGFELRAPAHQLIDLEEISCDCIHQIPDLVAFMERCYKALPVGGKMTITAPHYASTRAWTSPLTVRGLSQDTLNFCSKDWREAMKYTELTTEMNFDVTGHFAVEEAVSQRSEEAKMFWMSRYLNVVQTIVFTLVKKEP